MSTHFMPTDLPAAPDSLTRAPLINYLVVAGEMTTRDGPGALHGYQMVLASAPNSEEACEISRDALEDGFAPLAAFDHADLLALAKTLASHSLKPGGSFNLDAELTGEKMVALREADLAEDPDEEPENEPQEAAPSSDVPF